MPPDPDFKALHAELCKFLPKTVPWSELHHHGVDNSGIPTVVGAMCAVSDARKPIVRISCRVPSHDGPAVISFIDVPLTFAFESGLADLLGTSDYNEKMIVVARTIAYLESEHLGGPASESN